jgi:hypothetical protein
VDAQAGGLLVVIRDREEQKKEFNQGIELEHAGKKLQAKELFTRVVRASNGDLDLVASAKNEIDQIGAIREPKLDYSAAIGEVRELINQGRWDDASAKLSSVPPTQPEFTDLKGLLEAGRREDQYYGQMKTAFNGAHASKNKDALVTLRLFFTTEAGKGDRHSDEARGIVTQIDTDVKEIDASKTASVGGGGANSRAADIAAIKDVLIRYATAYDAGDMQGLIAVRQFDTKDQGRLQDLLAGVKGKGYTLQNCSAPQMGRVTARVNCTGVFTKATGIPPQPITFEMRRNNGQWIIVASN